MATKAPAYEEKIKRAIRDALAYDPLITQNALIEQLNRQFNHSFDFRYIRRLTDKVMGQAQIEVDRSQLSERLSALHETHRMARERLLSVPPSDSAAPKRAVFSYRTLQGQTRTAQVATIEQPAAVTIVVLERSAHIASLAYQRPQPHLLPQRLAPHPPPHPRLPASSLMRRSRTIAPRVESIIRDTIPTPR